MYKEDALLVTFVDDCGLAVKRPEQIKWFVETLRKKGFELEVEGDFTAFLGVSFEKLDDGRIHMNQPGLTKKLLEYTGMTDSNPNKSPNTEVGLGKDEQGEPWDESIWKMSAVVGMMLYLSTNTRPDISFAVSAVARHSKNPKHSHARAVKTILRYLKGTIDKGIYITLDGTMNLRTYCDADFAGLFGKESPRNIDGAKSRGGFVVFFGGVPLVWKSQLLSCICLSTLESEYQQLSKTMTVLIGIQHLMYELLTVLKEERLGKMTTMIACTVFEDNNGALILAKNQRVTNRTKYFHVKWHHFWSHVSNDDGKDGGIVVRKIDTKDQLADFLTKPLSKDLFEQNRKGVMGW